MPVEFHCEHCGKMVHAPTEAAGKKGKCPHCQGICYIPSPASDIEELPLAPLDDADERRRQAALKEAADLQYTLLHERAVPGDSGGATVRPTASGSARAPGRNESAPLGMPASEVEQLVAAFVSAMSDGQLERAERVSSRLANEREQVLSVIERISSGELSSTMMPKLPKPVLQGFLKQLRAKI